MGGRALLAGHAQQRRVVRLPVPQRRDLASRAFVHRAGLPHREPHPREGLLLGSLRRRGQLHLQQHFLVRGEAVVTRHRRLNTKGGFRDFALCLCRPGRDRQPPPRAVGGGLQRQHPRRRPGHGAVPRWHALVLVQVPL